MGFLNISTPLHKRSADGEFLQVTVSRRWWMMVIMRTVIKYGVMFCSVLLLVVTAMAALWRHTWIPITLDDMDPCIEADHAVVQCSHPSMSSWFWYETGNQERVNRDGRSGIHSVANLSHLALYSVEVIEIPPTVLQSSLVNKVIIAVNRRPFLDHGSKFKFWSCLNPT